MADIHVGDTGTRFELPIVDMINDVSVAVDISSATVKTIKFRGPDNVTVSKTAGFTTDGTDGKIDYTSITNDIDQRGQWKIQAYIEMPSGKFHTSMSSFGVSGNL